ncbi:MAG: DUF4199 domain-containing protein [Bacteroidetes bacterium]|nr:DUF4199 domain-containing protein [Bacteroidota bacterium]
MENQKSVIKPSLSYGLYLGIALILFSLIMYLLDIDRESPIMYISYLVMAGGLFWAMISFRDKINGGFVSYGKAFGTGFWTGLFAAIIGAIFTYIYVTMIDPGMIEEILFDAEEEILNSGREMSDQEIEQGLNFTEKLVANPVALTIWSFVMNTFFATILSLIIAIFVKREGTIEIVEEKGTEE